MFLKEQERKPYQRLKLGNDPRHLDPKCKERTRSPKALWNLNIRRGKKNARLVHMHLMINAIMHTFQLYLQYQLKNQTA